MFISKTDVKFVHNTYNDGTYKIKQAGVCDIYDIGGQPKIYEPDITAYQVSDNIEYTYF